MKLMLEVAHAGVLSQNFDIFYSDIKREHNCLISPNENEECEHKTNIPKKECLCVMFRHPGQVQTSKIRPSI